MSVNMVLSLLTILLVQIIIECVDTSTDFDGFKKIKNPFLFISSTKDSIIGNGINKNFNNSGNNNIFYTSQTPKIRGKKWQVGRVSRKHYEIVNMLWRKTKIFFDVETTPEHYYPRRGNESRKVNDNPLVQEQHTVLPSPKPLASTPSFIEFYYLDDTDDAKDVTTPKHVKHYTKSTELYNRNYADFRMALLNPAFAFRVNNPYYKWSATPTRFMRPTNRIHQRRARTFHTSLADLKSVSTAIPLYTFPHKLKLQPEVTTTFISNSKQTLAINVTKNLLNRTTEHSITEAAIDNETCVYTTEILNTVNKSEETMNTTLYETRPSTVYDKIKFFEMYDKHTYEPNYDYRKSWNMYDVEVVANNNNVLNKKILLEHADQSIEHNHGNSHKTKHAKKHIIENNKDGRLDNGNSIDKKLHLNPVIFKPTNRTTVKIKEEPLENVPENVTETELKLPKFLQQNVSTFATWYEYSFAAVYVYEPLQVHCDAAGISQHWLITAGSCLSRHHRQPGGTGRSAFVTYCGEAWWNPGRVAYVKYSVVHPRYHSRDRTRRHLYNVGLIQVVTSMASACSGWVPIPFMSHQLISDEVGSTATAIGWGLDRYDPQHPSTDLPRSPLTLYETRVYSDSCPGNVQYSKAKRLDDDGGIENVYCLSLPPYLSEENDPIHGSLLLVGGKLIALYLEEERRPWGEQCAIYTGTWRLIPWVLNVAHESDEADSFMV